MVNKKYLRKDAVIASVLATLIICSASVIVPTINGSTTTKAVNNDIKVFSAQKNEYEIENFFFTDLEEISYEKIFSSLEKELDTGKGRAFLYLQNKLINNIKKQSGDKYYTVFSSAYKYAHALLDSLYLTKPKELLTLKDKITFYLEQIRKDITEKTDTDKLSTYSTEIVASKIGDACPDEREIYPLDAAFNSKFFEYYWHNYTKLRDSMDSMSVTYGYEADNYEDWYDWATDEVFDEMLRETTSLVYLGAFIAVVALVPGTGLFGLSMISYIVTTYAFVRYTLYLINTEVVKSNFDRLWTKEIDIVLHATDTHGNGIKNLKITAINIDVPPTYNSKYIDGKVWNTNEKFTFTINPAYDKPEDGWYALSSRPWDDKSQPPPPPGIWEILIDGSQQGYAEWHSNTYEMQSSGIYINDNITLVCSQDEPRIYDEYPPDGATNIEYNTTLCVSVEDCQEDTMNIKFENYWNGAWHIIEPSYNDVKDGRYCANTTNFNAPETTYLWKVTAVDQHGFETEKIYSFTTK